MEARNLRAMPFPDYLALDRESEERWEYVNGEAFSMGGASPEHNVVVRNVLTLLTNALRDRPCRALPEGQKIATVATGAYHYPDVSVICGPPMRDARDDHALVNPTVLIEVLSPKTRDYDCGGKYAHYRTIDTLAEYVTIDPVARTVEHRKKVGEGRWLHTTEIRGGSLELASLGVSLDVGALWIDLDWLAQP